MTICGALPKIIPFSASAYWQRINYFADILTALLYYILLGISEYVESRVNFLAEMTTRNDTPVLTLMPY